MHKMLSIIAISIFLSSAATAFGQASVCDDVCVIRQTWTFSPALTEKEIAEFNAWMDPGHS